jgi:hypothetical protein
MLIGAIIGAVIGGIVGYTSFPVDPNAIDSHGIELSVGAFLGLLFGLFAGFAVALMLWGKHLRDRR